MNGASSNPAEEDVLPETLTVEETLTVTVEETLVQMNGASSTCNGKGPSEQNEEEEEDEDEEEAQPQTLEHAEELTEKGKKADQCDDVNEAVDCFSRALEIRVAHYGELAPECAYTYYRYGLALFYKAQKETDPLNEAAAKNTSNSSGRSNTTDKANTTETTCEAPMVLDTSSLKLDSMSSSNQKERMKDASENDQETCDEGAGDDGKENDEGDEDDGEDLENAAEEDSDLDLAWKMLDIARVIAEKNPADTMDKVNIITALGDVAAEREDMETSLGDYRKALSMLEHLVEPDSRRLAELHFKICLVLQLDNKIEDAVQYCQNAISVCESRLRRLREEVMNSIDLVPAGVDTGSMSKPDQNTDQSSTSVKSDSSILDKEKEIKTLEELLVDLGEKQEDLKQTPLNPRSPLFEVAEAVAAKLPARGNSSMLTIGPNSSQMAIATENSGFDSPTVSTAGTNDVVTHLGVVGRGVKRATPIPVTVADQSPKRTAPLECSSLQKSESSTCEDLDSGSK